MEFKGTNKEEFARWLEWTVLARFILYGIALIIANLRLAREVPFISSFFYLNLAIYLANIIYFILIKKRICLLFIAYLSFIADLLAITWALHLHGGLTAPIFPLAHLLVILGASILISLKAGVIIATVTSSLLALLISLEYYSFLPPVPVKGIGIVLYQAGNYVILVVISKIIFFYGVAIASGYLSDRIKKQAEEIREKQEQLIHAQRVATAAQLAAEEAHEIRNPLSVIKTGIYYLKQLLPKEEKIEKTISQIDAAVNRVASHIDGLLSFSRDPILKLSFTDINALIEESIKRTPPALLSNIEVSKELSKDIPNIKVDPNRLKQVFNHLIKNACEAMQENGRLKIESKKLRVKDEEFIQISFENNGIGIPEENLKKIFEPLFTTREERTGLGLAICKRLIEAHKGAIEVTSKVNPKDQKTAFIIRLPIKSVGSCIR